MSTYTSNEEIEFARGHQLVVAARHGDADAFGVLFEMNKHVIYSFVRKSICNPDDAEDIVQQTFVSAWRAIGGFRGDSRILTWLYKIAANLCKDYARRCRRNEQTSDNLEDYSYTLAKQLAVSPEDCYVIRQIIDDALREIPLEHRMLVVLCDMQGFTSKEAANVVGCSPVSARVRLCRAHARLRELLSPILDEVD